MSSKKGVVGKVVSIKNDKTIVVAVVRRFKHPLYSKIVSSTKKYHVHDENNQYKELGIDVYIEKSRPYSKLKHWSVIGKVG